MAKRSTRNKIKWHADEVVKHTEKIQQHLKQIDDLADGRSLVIARVLPGLLESSELFLTSAQGFRDRL